MSADYRVLERTVEELRDRIDRLILSQKGSFSVEEIRDKAFFRYWGDEEVFRTVLTEMERIYGTGALIRDGDGRYRVRDFN